MATQHEKRIEITTLLHALVHQKDIVEQTGASLRTIYNISKRLEAGDNLRHSPGAGRKVTVSTAQVKAAFKRKPNRSIAETAHKLNKSTSAVSRALKKAGGCSLALYKMPSFDLTPATGPSGACQEAPEQHQELLGSNHHFF